MQAPTVIALGGNAISPAQGAGTAAEQTANIARTMAHLADVIEAGRTAMVLTHGNGPQVGNVLIKNELAREVVPPVPLDWCVAQTQATIGFTIANTLGSELARRGRVQPVVPVVSRVLVDPDDAAFRRPTKPIGPWMTDESDLARREADGEHLTPPSPRGRRRVVASPMPLESLDRPAIELLLQDGAIVVANGGGGIPVAAGPGESLHGVEAVIDKDRAAALLGIELDATELVILTDVDGVALYHGTPRERWLRVVTVDELGGHARDGQFTEGSMGPKVEAACAFARATGRPAVIARLSDVRSALDGVAGTRILP